MKIFFLFGLLLSINCFATSSSPRKTFNRFQATGQLGYNNLTIETGSYSDPGMTFNGFYYVIPKLAVGAHYFLTVSPTGSSNINGIGLSAKYYFYNTETSFTLEDADKVIKMYDRYFAYGGFNFIDRDIRTSRLTISYSGFGASVGGGYKLNHKNSIGAELLFSQLKGPTGSADVNGTFSNFSIFYSYLF